MGLRSGLQDKSIAAARRKKKIIRMETHTTPGDEPLASKLHTHCRYRHRESIGPSSLHRYCSGRGSSAPRGYCPTAATGVGMVGPHLRHLG